MDIVLIIVILFLITLLIQQKKKTIRSQRDNGNFEQETSAKTELKINGAYHKRWMFSFHEKEAYKKLKAISDELGYIVFAKVRLLDILEPTKGTDRYKTYFYKIQAKHVDFVLCDQKLVAQYIIELDDSSHDTKERQERDKFVDEIVRSVGYKIIHTREITDDIKKQITSLK